MKITASSTLGRRWLLIFTVSSKVSKKSRKRVETKFIGRVDYYREFFNNLWKKTGISKDEYKYSELIDYGRK